jgi:hypothetical protein
MADMIKVYQAYSPKIKSAGMVEMHKVIEYIAGRTSLNAGTLYNVLYELHDCLVFHTQSGYSVRLEGLGTFAPTINRDGGFRLNYRPDKRLVVELGLDFRGDIRNKEMIGKSSEEFIAHWNKEHLEDPVKS